METLSMRTVIASLLSVGVLVAFAGAGSAADDRKKHRRHAEPSYTSFPTATERQLRNLRAYERGEYYERDSNALPAGSRPWWEQRERESGGGVRP
jgi:hypothetical protein